MWSASQASRKQTAIVSLAHCRDSPVPTPRNGTPVSHLGQCSAPAQLDFSIASYGDDTRVMHGPPARRAFTEGLSQCYKYCEIRDDVVFTVEYSVRSAQTAVYALLDIDKPVWPIFKGRYDLGVLLGSAKWRPRPPSLGSPALDGAGTTLR